MMNDDMTLVQEYAQSNSEQAFATLVSQHINLVYSVALRQVRNSHLAEEVSQAVFILLARKAKSLGPETILSGWLCRTARNIAANTIRTEHRRQFREQKSQMQSLLNEPDSDTWKQIAPLLDEALNSLGEKEHDAVVLRFFDGRELKQVGAAMGTTEDAARMQVNRAVEKLRKFFSKKGVSVSEGLIAGVITANSVQAAPAGLAATITAAALSGTAITTTAVIAASKTVAMTTLQKTIVTVVFAAAVGTGIYESRQAANARAETQTLQQGQAPLKASIEQLQRELSDATNRLVGMADTLAKASRNDRELLALRGEVTRLRRESELRSREESGVAGSADKSWLDRVGRLRQRLEQTPEAQIPELKFLTDADWLNAASHKLDTDDDYRAAFDRLRASGENHFLQIAETALRKFLENHHGEFPTELSQLASYFDTPPADEILRRYQIVPESNVPKWDGSGETNGWLITLKSPDSEAIQAVGKNGFRGTSAGDLQEMSILASAMKAAFEASPIINGTKTLKLEDLVPYLTTPEQTAAYQKMMKRKNAASK